MRDRDIAYRVEKLWRQGIIDVQKTKELLNDYCNFFDIEAEIIRLEKLVTETTTSN